MENIEEKIKKLTQSQGFFRIEKLQSLWQGYGQLYRYTLKNAPFESVIVKHIKFPDVKKNKSDFSHNRKINSYKVEIKWYDKWNKFCDATCKTPACIGFEVMNGEILLILEDLNESGYNLRKNSLQPQQMQVCLSWLANFHAVFMGKKPEGLWKWGTYWHLNTRPDELKALKDKSLKEAAPIIDKALRNSPFQTFVHGDAKLENFCFSKNNQVAAVDFQYVGKGCGMKDVAYFIGSCLHEETCQRHEEYLLNSYFTELKKALIKRNSTICFKDLEANWRKMFPLAWTDFHRFLKGWTHGNWSPNCYSEKISLIVLKNINKYI